MYFPIGWPKVLSIPQSHKCSFRQVICNRDKILFAILTDNCLSVWFCKPCVQIILHCRSDKSIEECGVSELVEWRPDSSMLVVTTAGGYLLLYKLGVVAEQRGLYEQLDSPHANLRRDSDELFIKEVIPPLSLTLEKTVGVEGCITSLVCIRDELMLATTRGHVLRYRWDGSLNRDYCLDLRRVPFCTDQQVAKAIPIVEANTFVTDIEYSPLVGGFAIVLNDGRAAFLTATSLRFDPNQVQGIWAQNIDDASCASVNHKYRLIVFGRKNSQAIAYCIDESTGGLEVSHHMVLSSRDYPGAPGAVTCVRWTPDGCAVAVAWRHGGLSLWSTFGALLLCSLGWDYGLHADLSRENPLLVTSMEWSAEGYQLWMVRRQSMGGEVTDSVAQLDFVKSALTVNPCMSQQGHLCLQGESCLYVNLGDNLVRVYHERSCAHGSDDAFLDVSSLTVSNCLVGSKQWIVVPIPSAYAASNWPIRYTAIDCDGQNIAVAGRTGLAHYSLGTRKWTLFGNETQEKDFVVTGGLLWWRDHVMLGCYSIAGDRDELRLYPRDSRLDDASMSAVCVPAQVLLLSALRDRLITFCASGQVSVHALVPRDGRPPEVSRLQSVDISALCVHPACVVSVTLTALRTESSRHSAREAESIMLNISGRLLVVPREQAPRQGDGDDFQSYTCAPPTVLASCVENVWLPRRSRRDKPHLTEALWLFCGAHGMRVWLPLFPRDADKPLSFMSKRIMLPFQLSIYPLAILFEDAILLGAENDTMLYSSDSSSPFSLPFCVLERTSQVYLHQVLRQLIRRNLGYHAWEIARSCAALPYFPHSLELLLHEVLEEEATSKEPIPDALLPSVVEFIQEFPVYLQTVVQCARKTEIALWPYLFSAAGKPKDLFQQCLSTKLLDTAASYLIILQNLEPSTVSRQYATLLLDAALDQSKWELSKELVRFLRAIDPNDVESPRASFILPSKYGVNPQTPPVSPNEEDLSLVLGTMQLARGRSFSTTTTPKMEVAGPTHHREVLRSSSGAGDSSKSVPLRRKKSVPTGRADAREASGSAEEFFIDVILQRHARRLLTAHRLTDLGHFAAQLDFHLVSWLGRERDRAARVDDFVGALRRLHQDFSWPCPTLLHPVSYYLRRSSASAAGSSPALATAEQRAGAGDGAEDSGYTSHPGAAPVYPRSLLPPSEYPTSPAVEAKLLPHLLPDESSVVSEESSFWGAEDKDQYASECGDTCWNQVPSSILLDQLSQELSSRGSPDAEVKLRYLLQLFTEARCLEWALVVSVLLRDGMAVLRTTGAARAPDQSAEAVLRLRDGLQQLCAWSSTESLGYKPFMMGVQTQVGLLTKLHALKRQQQTAEPPAPTTPPPSRSRLSSGTSPDEPSSGALHSGKGELPSQLLPGAVEQPSPAQQAPSDPTADSSGNCVLS
ncbi:guanine nucleotide exchange factor subunit Rich [Bacillus rossius redtenbacheri]|uniref:guanine nucleotide exchange factor subunit Rich n=1 Tax=Bacillus rossius redtenbacheri TaxID=93214 RepID=UPI002FDDDA06